MKNTVGLLASRRPDLRSPVAKKLKAIVLDEGVDAARANAKNLGLTKRQVLDMCKLWICDDDYPPRAAATRANARKSRCGKSRL